MFSPYKIVMCESPNCPPCEKMDLKIIQSLLEKVKICRKHWKCFSEEQQAVELLSRGLHSRGFPAGPDQISCAAGLNSRIKRSSGR